MTHRWNNSKGFTLLELILAMTVVGVIAAISVISVRLAVSSHEIGERKTELYQRLRFIGEQLTEKIRSAHPIYLTGGEDQLFANLNQDRSKGKRILAFDGNPKSVRFITTSPRLQDTDEQAPDLHEVRFFLGKNPETGEQGVILMERPLSYQTAMKDTPESLEEATFVTLAQKVDTFKLRYLQAKTVEEEVPGQTTKTVKYVTEWVDTVNTELIEFVGKSSSTLFQKAAGAAGRISLPRAIEISLALQEIQPPKKEDDFKEPEEAPAVSVPPVIIPLHTGLVFERMSPVPAENGQVKS